MITRSKSSVISFQSSKGIIFSKSWTIEYSLLLKKSYYVLSRFPTRSVAPRFRITYYITKLAKVICDIGLINPDVPNQFRTRYQREQKQWQPKNKWVVIYGSTQPLTQSRKSLCKIPRRVKLSLVVRLLWKSHHENTNTFKGTCLRQDIFGIDETWPGV